MVQGAHRADSAKKATGESAEYHPHAPTSYGRLLHYTGPQGPKPSLPVEDERSCCKSDSCLPWQSSRMTSCSLSPLFPTTDKDGRSLQGLRWHFAVRMVPRLLRKVI